MSDIRKTTGHLAIYAIGNFLVKIIGLVLLPIYTRELSLNDFGIYAIIEVTAQILIAIISFNLATGMLKWISDEKDKLKRGEIVFTTASASFVIALFFAIIGIIFSKNISLTFFENSNYTLIIIFVSINILLEVINKIPLNLIRFLEKPMFYSISLIMKFIISTGAIIYFVVYQHQKIEGIFLGFIIGNIFYLIMTFKVIKENWILKFNKKIGHEIFKFSAPLIWGTLGMMIFTSSDRYIIKMFRPFDEVGLYSFASKVSKVVNMIIVQSFNLALLPMVFKIYHTEKGKQFLASISKLIAILIGFILIGITYFGYDFISLFITNKSYLNSFNVILILVFAYIFNALRYIFMLHLYVTKKTKLVSYILLITASINIALNIIFVNIWNYEGAAYATLISTIIMMVGFYFIGQKYYRVNYAIGQISFIILSTLGFVLLNNILPQSGYAFFIRIMLLISYVVILYMTKILRFDQLLRK